MPDVHTDGDPNDKRPGIEASRFKNFSDGIFAIILTIMIVALKPPSSEGMAWFNGAWPTIVAYALSYLFVAVCWLNHHYNLRNIERVSAPLIWSNFVFLFWMSLLPFSTAYLADRNFSQFSMLVYVLGFLPITASYMIFECSIAVGSYGDSSHRKWLWIAMLRGALALALFGLAATLAYPSTKAAFAIVLAVPLLWVFPERVTRLGLRLRGRRSAARVERAATDREEAARRDAA